MERFVVGAAIVVAVAIAAAATFGGSVSGKHGLTLDFSSDTPAASSPGRAVSVPAATYEAQRVKLEDIAAVITVVAEPRTTVEITIANPGRLPTPRVELQGDRVVVDGGVRHVRGCDGKDSFSATVKGFGTVAEADLPVITIKTPMAVEAAFSGAAKTSVSASESAKLSFSGCGPAKIGASSGLVDISVSGSADSVVDGAGSLDADLAGAGDLTVGAVTNGVKLDVAGASDVVIAALQGPAEISIAGSGSTRIENAKATDTEVSIAGSGDVTFVGDVGRLETNVAGSGEVTVTGVASDVKASVMGSGDVRVGAVTGRIDQSVMGSGRVRVGK